MCSFISSRSSKAMRCVHRSTGSKTRKAATYILDEQGNARIEIADVPLEDKVLLGLGRNAGLQVAQSLLS
jgi:hypothetical protein